MQCKQQVASLAWLGLLRMRYGLRLLTVDEGGSGCRIRTSRKTRHPNPRAMTATTIALLLALLLLPLLVLLWATESTEQRVKRLRSYGWAQRRIAEHMNITRYRVRQVLA